MRLWPPSRISLNLYLPAADPREPSSRLERLLRFFGPSWHRAPLRRILQAACLLLFLYLFFCLAWPYGAINEKISFEWNSVVEEIIGDSAVRSIRLKDVREEGKKKTLEVDGVFIFTGNIPNTSQFQGITAMDADGYIIVDPHMMTSAPGIFACGDCTAKLLKQVVTACGDGATAAFAAYEYVSKLKGTSYEGLKRV